MNKLHPVPVFKGATAATLEVAVAPGEVQASAEPASGANNIALAIAALRGGAADQRYGALVTLLGAGVQDAQASQANLQAVVNTLSSERQSVSGVSLDEEMTNLISYQRGYQSSARALNAMNEVLETLINHTGL